MFETRIETLDDRYEYKCPYCKEWLNGSQVEQIYYFNLGYSGLYHCKNCGKRERACDWIQVAKAKGQVEK